MAWDFGKLTAYKASELRTLGGKRKKLAGADNFRVGARVCEIARLQEQACACSAMQIEHALSDSGAAILRPDIFSHFFGTTLPCPYADLGMPAGGSPPQAAGKN